MYEKVRVYKRKNSDKEGYGNVGIEKQTVCVWKIESVEDQNGPGKELR